MSCQHTWIKVNRAYEDYQCSQCEMSLSVDEYDAIQQAHREGWEQAKREAFEIARTTQIGYIQTTIAAMEYGGNK